MRHPEAQSQRAVLTWWKYACHALKCAEVLLFSVPNGGYRRTREAALLKLEGCRAGAPDLLLLVPVAPYHGMVLEMKAPGGKESEEQKTFLGELIAQGYKVVVAYSTEEAIQAITGYLRGINGTASAA